MKSELEKALDSARLYLDSLQREQDERIHSLATVAPGPEYAFICSRLVVLEGLVERAKVDIADVERKRDSLAFALSRRVLTVQLRKDRRRKSA